ncbi:putative deoxyuridine 5 -triphosphate nucleotidohydrolase protein [Lasiodiplodia theobromae]|nr:putative deoxyuridine 5 -triphosphate nucleotidohydrolase protein [Lasiodiplodia theobromae]
MSESNNDPSATPSLSHDPPSLPASPVGLLGVHLQLKMRLRLTGAAGPEFGDPRAALCIAPFHRKRTKHIDLEPPANATSALHHASTIAAGDESGTATPTPIAMSTTTAALAPAPESTTMQVQLLSENAKAPTKGSAFAAGHDLYSSADTVIPARKWALVPTDIKISVPAGTF